MTRYINYHKRHEFIAHGDHYLVFNLSSCWKANKPLVDVVSGLPRSGTREDYIDFLRRMNVDAPEAKVDLLIQNNYLREQKFLLGIVFRKILSPKILLLKGRWIGWLMPKAIMHTLFSLKTAATIITLFLVALTNYLLNCKGGPTQTWNAYSYLWLLLGVFAHEIGHSSACAHYGIGYRPVGLSWYLIWPIAFTNVSGAELVPVDKRMIINLSGLYFQMAFMVVALFAGYIFPGCGAIPAFGLLLYILLFNLNPFITTDGYWCMKDCLLNHDLKRRNVLEWIYKIGFIVFTGYIAMRTSRHMISLIGNYRVAGLSAFSFSFSSILSSFIVIYIQILVIRGIFRRLMKVKSGTLGGAEALL